MLPKRLPRIPGDGKPKPKPAHPTAGISTHSTPMIASQMPRARIGYDLDRCPPMPARSPSNVSKLDQSN